MHPQGSALTKVRYTVLDHCLLSIEHWVAAFQFMDVKASEVRIEAS